MIELFVLVCALVGKRLRDIGCLAIIALAIVIGIICLLLWPFWFLLSSFLKLLGLYDEFGTPTPQGGEYSGPYRKFTAVEDHQDDEAEDAQVIGFSE